MSNHASRLALQRCNASVLNPSHRRQVLDCASPLALFRHAVPKRQKTAALQDAIAFSRATIGLLAAGMFAAAALLPARAQEVTPAYKNPNLPVEQRVKNLLSRMTLEEKVRQLDMYDGCKALALETNYLYTHNHATPDAPFDAVQAEKTFGTLGAGSIHDIYPSVRLYNQFQAWVIKNNHLGIPAIFIEEGLHGYMGWNETIFPQSVNLASTWNTDLARAEGAAIASEVRAEGVDMLLCPVLDVARDPRWGRVEEDFGEDPFLSGQMGLNYVLGMQGESLATDHTCIAEPKHFAGHGSPESGLNTSPVHAGEREMRTVMLKTFEPAIREGHALGVMVAYNDVDGVPCTGNPWLLKTVLKGEWGFQGFTISDLGAIGRLYKDHHTAATPADACRQAVNAGVDMQFYDFPHDVFQNAIIDGVKNGQVTEATLDDAVSRILRVKFLLGLFDHPFVDESLDAKVRRVPAHLDLSLEVARQSLCLLKNENNLLPLNKDLKRIAVIGPNANVAQTGDYTGGDESRPSAEFGIFAQVKKIVGVGRADLPVGSDAQQRVPTVSFADGSNIDDAVALATNADVAILGLGENSKISGEGRDRADLDLPGNQEQLLEAVAGTGVPVVLVLENGRPLTIPWAAAHVPAILEAWYPGEFGGQAVAGTLFGDNNPAGRLDITFPKRIGQLPDFYNHFPSKHFRYVTGDNSVQYVFGWGLSYTTFKYDNLKITAPAGRAALPRSLDAQQRVPTAADVLVTFDLTNTGERAGDEVAQAYVRETTASVATPERALKAFARVHLDASETKTITLRVKQSDLEVWGAEREWKLEPGEFTVWVGGNSDAKLSAKFNLQ